MLSPQIPVRMPLEAVEATEAAFNVIDAREDRLAAICLSDVSRPLPAGRCQGASWRRLVERLRQQTPSVSPVSPTPRR